MKIKLSVCIPVYNFGAFLGSTLDSIVSQLEEGVEIVVFDGGSTDATPSVVASYAERDDRVRYHRAKNRGGIDADLATCVSLAQGEYCWLFSGDDIMRPGAIASALAESSTGADVYLPRHGNSTLDMDLIGLHPVLIPNERLVADWSQQDSRREWFRRAANTEAFFSFMSTVLVRRQTWLGGALPGEFDRSCWGHVARLFGIATTVGLRTVFVPEAWLDRRGGNDSFADRGLVNRFRIAIEGYTSIVDHYFGQNSFESFHVRRALRAEHGIKEFALAHAACRASPHAESGSLLSVLHGTAYADWSPGMMHMHRCAFMAASLAVEPARLGLRFMRGLTGRRR